MKEGWLYTTVGSSRAQLDSADTRGLTQARALALAEERVSADLPGELSGIHITAHEEQNDESDVPLNRF